MNEYDNEHRNGETGPNQQGEPKAYGAQNTGWNSVGYTPPAPGGTAQPPNGDAYRFQYEDYTRNAVPETTHPVRKHKGKRAMAAGIVLASIVGMFVIAFASYGVYQAFFGSRSPVVTSSSSDKKTQELNITDKPSDAAAQNTGGRMTTEQVSAKVRPSVVGVVSYAQLETMDEASQGSGIIMSSDGYLITNAHVVDSTATLIKVILYNGEEYKARIVGLDKRTDLAVLKIDASNLVFATFGNSDQLQVGETVLAIGNPGGMELAGSVTMGIVSAVNRSVVSETGYTMKTVQTDAAINPGNSGGALVNLYGQVIGINSLKIAATEYEGIGFAIPINDAKPIIDQLIEYGRVPNRVKLGVSLQEIGSVAAKTYNVPEGLLIAQISAESNLAKKGVVSGDIITAVNGTSTKTISDLMGILGKQKPGDTATVTVYRRAQNNQGKTMEVTIVLQADNS